MGPKCLGKILWGRSGFTRSYRPYDPPWTLEPLSAPTLRSSFELTPRLVASGFVKRPTVTSADASLKYTSGTSGTSFHEAAACGQAELVARDSAQQGVDAVMAFRPAGQGQRHHIYQELCRLPQMRGRAVKVSSQWLRSARVEQWTTCCDASLALA